MYQIKEQTGNNVVQATQQRNSVFLLYAHLFICSFGLFGLALSLSSFLSSWLINPFFLVINFASWAELASLGKARELFAYIVGITSLLLYYLITTFMRAKYWQRILTQPTVTWLSFSLTRLAGYLIGLLVLNAVVVKWHGWLGLMFWTVLLLIPFKDVLIQAFHEKYEAFSVKIAWLLVAAIAISVLMIFYPYLRGGLPVANEYTDIPEQTWLNGKLVDNTQYINEHRIGGLVKYDPYKDQGQNPEGLESTGVKLEPSAGLDGWLKIHAGDGRYFYDVNSQTFYMKDPLKADVDGLLTTLQNSEERGRIANLYQARSTSKIYTPEEMKFVKKNGFELLTQSLAGHYFHHQFAALNPINEYLLGRYVKKIDFLYGWGNSVLLAKAIDFSGGLSFERYIQFSYSLNPLYFLAVILVAYLIFRDVWYTLFVAIIYVSCLFFLGFENIRFAPGFNPIRHFLDIFVLLSFYYYRHNGKVRYLAGAFAGAILAILASTDFGLILFIALLLTQIFINMREGWHSKEWGIVIGASALAIMAVFQIPHTDNQTVQYTLMGVGVPATSLLKVFVIVACISFVFMLIAVSKSREKYWDSLILWFIYAQGLLIYFVWNPAWNHLLSLGGIAAFFFALLFKTLVAKSVDAHLERKILSLLTILIMPLFLVASITYAIDYINYKTIFDTHRIYKWNFNAAKFKTTMNPGPFVDSVNLIDRYSTGPGIFIISKYDNILPFLAGKYSEMPFSEMGLNLVTEHELDKTIRLINEKRPRYIYIDTDILRLNVGDIYDDSDKIEGYLTTGFSSRGRAMVLDHMKKVFEAVKADYKPIKRGLLITVYERIQ